MTNPSPTATPLGSTCSSWSLTGCSAADPTVDAVVPAFASANSCTRRTPILRMNASVSKLSSMVILPDALDRPCRQRTCPVVGAFPGPLRCAASDSSLDRSRPRGRGRRRYGVGLSYWASHRMGSVFRSAHRDCRASKRPRTFAMPANLATPPPTGSPVSSSAPPAG